MLLVECLFGVLTAFLLAWLARPAMVNVLFNNFAYSPVRLIVSPYSARVSTVLDAQVRRHRR